MALNKYTLKNLIQSKITAIFEDTDVPVSFTGNSDKGIEAFADAIVTHLIDAGLSGSISPEFNNLDALGIYVGAPSGSISPDYFSTIYITDGDNVTTAVGTLDAGLNLVSSSFTYETLDRVTDRGNITDNNITVNTIIASSSGSQLKDTFINGDLQVTGNFLGDVKATGNLMSNNNVYINYNGPDANSFLFFYEGGQSFGAFLKFDDGDNRFEFSKALDISGIITATASGSQLPSLDVGGNLTVGGNIIGNITDTTFGDITVNTITATSSGSQFKDTVVSGSLDLANHKIINVNDPTNPQDAATKIYTDSIGPQHGFEPDINNKTTLNFNSGSRTFTLTYISDYKYYLNGVEYSNTGDDSVTITDTEGVWYIFYNSSGVLTASQTVWDFEIEISVALIYWDATNNIAIIIGDERHTTAMTAREHLYHHQTQGTKYATGFVGTIYSSPNADKITIAVGVVYDEDIRINVTDGSGSALFEQDLSTTDAYSRLPVFYRSGVSAWRKFDATDHPFYDDAGGDRVYYNLDTAGNWSAVESTNAARYVAYWIFATDEKNEPIMVIMGQDESEITLSNATANYTPDSLDLGTLPIAEMKLLYRIIIKNNSIEDITDYRSSTGTPVSSFVTNSHSSLSNLGNDDHPQYLLVDGVRAATQLYSEGNVYLNVSGSDGDSYLYFYEGGSPTGEYLKWDDGDARFEFSDDLYASNTITANSHVQAGGDIYVYGNARIDADMNAAISYIYFYGTAQSFAWNQTDTQFEFSNKINVGTSGSWFKDTAIDGNLQLSSNGVIQGYVDGALEVLKTSVDRFHIDSGGVATNSYIQFHNGASYIRADYGGGRFLFSHSLWTLGNFYAYGNAYINFDGGEGDSIIYFYENGSATGASLMWDDSFGGFDFSHKINVDTSGSWLKDTQINGDLHVQNSIYSDTENIYSEGSFICNWKFLSQNEGITFRKPGSGQERLYWDYPNEYFWFTNDVAINGDLSISVLPGNDPTLHFWEFSASGSLTFDESETEFLFSDHLKVPTLESVAGITAGAVITGGELKSNNDIYIKYAGGDGDSYLYFYEGGSPAGRHLKWNDSANRFEFNDLVYASAFYSTGAITAATAIRSNANFYTNYDGPDGDSYLYFYENSSNTGRYLKWNDGANKFELNDSLSITGWLSLTSNMDTAGFVWSKSGTIYIGEADGDHNLYFYKGSTSGRYLRWSNTNDQFEMNDDLDIAGLLRCNSFRIDQTPTGGDPTTDSYIVVNCNGTNYRIPCVAD